MGCLVLDPTWQRDRPLGCRPNQRLNPLFHRWITFDFFVQSQTRNRVGCGGGEGCDSPPSSTNHGICSLNPNAQFQYTCHRYKYPVSQHLSRIHFSFLRTTSFEEHISVQTDAFFIFFFLLSLIFFTKSHSCLQGT